MKPLENHRSVTSEGVAASANFELSFKDQAHIKTILRDTLYSDKHLAVLREYAANAWDAHRMAGKADLPIKVTLPTYMDPTLIIQDFGPGLSHEDVFEIYTKYGASTKRDSDTAVGMLGIGSKSGFAYTDSFTIISCHGGKRRTYVALLDQNDNEVMNLLAEEDCLESETGITVQIAVQPSDIQIFHRKAQELFPFFNPLPDINFQLKGLEYVGMVKTSHGFIYPDRYSDGRWFVVMGCVPYRIDLDQLKGIDGNLLVPESLRQHGGVLYMGIGEVQISASREELKYGKYTNAALVKKFVALLDEYVREALSDIDSSNLSPWEKRLRARPLAKLKIEVPDQYKELLQSNVSIPTDLLTHMTIRYPDGREVNSINVAEDAEFVLRDDYRKLEWFDINRFVYVVAPRFKDSKDLTDDEEISTVEDVEDDSVAVMDKKPASVPVSTSGRERHSMDDVRACLDLLCEAMGVTGIKIAMLSAKHYSVPYRVQNLRNRRLALKAKEYNPKHHAQAFRWNQGHATYDIKSENWEVIKRPPTENDPYVSIFRFEVEDFPKHPNFFEQARRIKLLCEQLGIPMPEIYGYKNTVKYPLDKSKVVGKPFLEWVEEWEKTLITPEVQECWELQKWSTGMPNSIGPNHHNFKTLVSKLGIDHPICQFVKTMMANRSKLKKVPEDLKAGVYELERRGVIEKKTSKALTDRNSLHETYPLLDTLGSVEGTWRSHISDKLLDYVQLVDTSK